MSIDIAPETERLVREEIRSGHFRSVDEMIISGVHAWREKHSLLVPLPPEPEKSLLQFFRDSPLVGLELEFERDKDAGRDIVL